jgi:hypothetical protein
MDINTKDIKSFSEEHVKETEGDGQHLIFTPLPCGKFRISALDIDGNEVTLGYSWPPCYTLTENITDEPTENRPLSIQAAFLQSVTCGSKGGG